MDILKKPRKEIGHEERIAQIQGVKAARAYFGQKDVVSGSQEIRVTAQQTTFKK